MSKLFKLSYQARRENFVQARFCQEDVFGREGIEEWVKSQRVAKKPDWEAWQGYLAKDMVALAVGGQELKVLGDVGGYISSTRKPEGADAQMVWDNTQALRSVLARDTLLYELLAGFIIVILKPPAGFSCTGVFLSQQMILEPVGPFRIAEAALVSWWQQSPNRNNARKFLCDALVKSIKSHRAGAEKDFDSAVACSADGRKIVHANQVSIHEEFPGIKLGVYEGLLFVKNKILRSSDFSSCNHYSRYMSVDHDQIFERSSGTLFTSQKYCPKLK